MAKEEKLYPVVYKGVTYTKRNIYDLFKAFYHSKESVDINGGIYIGDGMVVYPDGSCEDNG